VGACRTADGFSALRWSQAMALEVGNELLIYTTRGCFHNPTRDVGRVMGLANVTTRVRDLTEPVVFGERRYTSGCELAVQGVAALREGVESGPLVTELHVFPDAETWGMQLRRPLVPLDEHDARALKRYLATLLEPLDHHLNAYLQVAKRRYVQQRSAASAQGSVPVSTHPMAPAMILPGCGHYGVGETAVNPTPANGAIRQGARHITVSGNCVGKTTMAN
jgi:hypothetical protein